MTSSSSGPDQPECQPEHQPEYQPQYQAQYQAQYQGPPRPAEAPPSQILPPEVFPPQAYLPLPSGPPAPRGGRGKKIIAGAAVLAVLAGGAVAAYAYTVLASSGVQPEKVLPATTVAFAKLDLDPAAGQKIAAYRLSAKFPAVAKGAPNIDAEKNTLLSAVFGDGSDFDYTTEIKPWLGDRIAVAAVPDADSEAGLDPVLAVAYTNKAKMEAALSKAARTEKDLGYVTTDGYVLISDSQRHAEAVLAGVRRGALAGVEHYRSDLKSLHGDQLAVGWADTAAVVAALKAGSGSAATEQLDQLQKLDGLAETKARIILGAHASADYLEISAASHGAGTGATPLGRTPVNGTLAKLAADTSAALEVTGLGDSLSQAWTGASATLGLQEQFEGLIEETGLQLPGDLAALFGADATLSARLPKGADGDPEIAAQVSTTDADRAVRLVGSVVAPFGLPADSVHAQRTADGYLVSNSASYDPRARPGAGTLGADPTFQKAVPGSAGASLIAYVNLGGILDSDPQASAKDKADWKHLGAFGMSVVPTSDGTRMTIRLTTR